MSVQAWFTGVSHEGGWGKMAGSQGKYLRMGTEEVMEESL